MFDSHIRRFDSPFPCGRQLRPSNHGIWSTIGVVKATPKVQIIRKTSTIVQCLTQALASQQGCSKGASQGFKMFQGFDFVHNLVLVFQMISHIYSRKIKKI